MWTNPDTHVAYGGVNVVTVREPTPIFTSSSTGIAKEKKKPPLLSSPALDVRLPTALQVLQAPPSDALVHLDRGSSHARCRALQLYSAPERSTSLQLYRQRSTLYILYPLP